MTSTIRLSDLTEQEQNDMLIPGTVIAYQDMANPYQEWTITKLVQDRWGWHAVCTNEEGDKIHLTLHRGYQYGWRLVECRQLEATE
jgi:hypothetical protein